MKYFRTAFLFCALFSLGTTAAVAQSQFQSWNHGTNAALFAVSDRQYVDIGLVNVGVTANNSSFAYSDILQESVTLDFNDIADHLDGTDLLVNAHTELGTHGTVRAARVNAGAFINLSHISQATIPNSFFEVLADGLSTEDGETVRKNGKGALIVRTMAETGVHSTYDALDHTFALKAAAYLPLFYSDDAGLSYDLYLGSEPNDDGNIADLSGEVSGRILSSINFDNPSEFDLGLKIDVGIIHRDNDGRAMYGGGINNIPIIPAQARYQVAGDLGFSITSEGSLQALLDGEDPFTIDAPDAGDAITAEALDSPRSLFPETSVSGFYRVDIPYIDLIPHAEMVFGPHSRLNAGLVLQGDLPVLRWLSLGLQRQDYSWQTNAALRIPLRIVEFTAGVGVSSPRFSNMFNGQGLTANTGISIGW